MSPNSELEKILPCLDCCDLKDILDLTHKRHARYITLGGDLRSNLNIFSSNYLRHLPFQVRFGLLHALFALLIILLLPPVEKLPTKILLITWGASFSLAVTAYGVVFPHSKLKKKIAVF